MDSWTEAQLAPALMFGTSVAADTTVQMEPGSRLSRNPDLPSSDTRELFTLQEGDLWYNIIESEQGEIIPCFQITVGPKKDYGSDKQYLQR